MSGRAAMRVLECNLKPSLKLVAVTMALFGNDQGSRIFPSVERVAWLTGMGTRAVRAQLAQLRELGVLVPVSPLTGGRRNTVRYQLRLPFELDRPLWTPGKPGMVDQGFGKDEAGIRVSLETLILGTETLQPDAETLSLATANPDPGNSRSVSDPVEERQEERRPERRDGAQAPKERFIELLRKSHPEVAQKFERVRVCS